MSSTKVYKRTVRAYNEMQLEHATSAAEAAKCNYVVSEWSTKITVSGKLAAINKFIDLYNE